MAHPPDRGSSPRYKTPKKNVKVDCAGPQTGFGPLTESQQEPYHGQIAVPGRIISLYFVPYEFLLHKGTTIPDTLPGHIQVFDVCFASLFAFQFE